MKKVERPEDERAIALAVPFDRRLPDVSKILHQHYNLLVQRNPGVKEWMRRAPMVAHLRPANLRDFLVRAKLPPVDRRQGAGRGVQPGFKKCGKARCLCCIYSASSRTHTSTLTNQTWPISRGSPVKTPTWFKISHVLMGLDNVNEDQPNMSEKWAPQGRVETGAQSTGQP